MRKWNFLQFSIKSDHLELGSAIVGEMGTQGIHEQPLTTGWVLLKAYFDPSDDINELSRILQLRCREVNVSLVGCVTGVEHEKDWLKKWRLSLKAFAVGGRFWISPQRNLTQSIAQDRIPIWIEPQMAFGAGTHETTQLCLEILEKLNLTGKTVLDIGTGSGILAIASAKLGADSVLACDIDSVAIQIAGVNCQRNYVSHQIRLLQGEMCSLAGKPFEVILANLDGNLIKRQLKNFGKHLKPGGQLILSGLLGPDTEGIRRLAKFLALPLTLLQELAKGEWRCLVFVRT